MTIFSDFLTALRVPHTRKYSDSRFGGLTFKSLFGLSRLLDEYGVPNAAWRVPKQGSAARLPVPCLAQKPGNFVIVTAASPERMRYVYQGKTHEVPTADFEKNWTGVVLTAKPGRESREPDYVRHRILDFAAAALTWIMVAAILFVLGYLYVTRGYWHSFWASALVAVNLAGIVITSMLMLKSLNVHTRAADRVCGILQRGGCDKILAMDASKFFGLFGWSEVGLGYFLVSTAAILFFPGYLPWLAAANLCCLPFSFWSVWYQKYRARHWCTLCLITQALLWCAFFCYLFARMEPWSQSAAGYPLLRGSLLLSCYIAAVLLLNKIADLLNKKQ